MLYFHRKSITLRDKAKTRTGLCGEVSLVGEAYAKQVLLKGTDKEKTLTLPMRLLKVAVLI